MSSRPSQSKKLKLDNLAEGTKNEDGEMDYFKEFPVSLVLYHLAPAIMEDPMTFINMMKAYDSIRELSLTEMISKPTIAQKMFESNLSRHFNDLNAVYESLKTYPEWQIMVEKYHEKVYGFGPAYADYQFLKVNNTKPFIDTPEMKQLWLMGKMDFCYGKEERLLGRGPVCQELLTKASSPNNDGYNPFLRRRVYLDYDGLEEMGKRSETEKEVELSSSQKTLERFGSNMRAATIEWYNHCYFDWTIRDYSNFEEISRHVNASLKLMPRLTTLRIFGCELPGVQKFELPELPQLLNLSLINSWSIPFTGCFHQLTTLHVADKDFLYQYDPDYHSTFPNLKRLSLSVSSGSQLRKLFRFTCALKEAKFTFPYNTGLEFCLLAFQRFSKTLVAGTLVEKESLWRTKLEDLGLDDSVNDLVTNGLPYLRMLNIHFDTCCKSLNGLLYLKATLRHLVIKVEHPPPIFASGHQHDPQPEKLHVWVNRHHLYDSNVRPEMPALIEIKLEDYEIKLEPYEDPKENLCKLYTRSEFEESLLQNEK